MKDAIVQHLKSFEKEHDAFTLTVSIGHFLLHDKDLSAVSYEEENGLQDFLAYLSRAGWEKIEEAGVLVGCRRDSEKVILGVGGQVNWVYGPFIDMQEIDKAYLAFIEELFDELKRKHQILLSSGHQPVTPTADIQAVPIPKYEALQSYTESHASYADYLKASAFIEVGMEYAHVDNFEKRYQAAMIIQPALAALFDNTAWVEGAVNQKKLYNINNLVASDERLYHVETALKDSFRYEDYAEFLLKAEPLCKEMMPEGGLDTLRDCVHPMVSVTDKGLTIANIDSVPYPLNMALILMIKALLYTPDHMTAIQKVIEEMHEEKILASRVEILKDGLDGKMGDGTAFDLIKDLYFMMTLTVNPNEQHYLQPLNSLVFKNVRPAVVGSKQFANMLGE